MGIESATDNIVKLNAVAKGVARGQTSVKHAVPAERLNCLIREKSVAHSILARSNLLQQWPHTFAHTTLVTLTFRLRQTWQTVHPELL